MKSPKTRLWPVAILMSMALGACGGSPSGSGSASSEDEGVSVTMLSAAELSGPKAWALFGAEPRPSAGTAQSWGSYAKGCAGGLVELPETGPTWQAMRLSRNRNWGHPQTVSFIEDLSVQAARQPGWSGLYVGDIGQPRGGPMKSGHASHQMGLDVDIWMLPPKRLNLSRSEREGISSISVKSADQRHVSGNWTPQHAAILEAAARDPRVDRIFVTAPAKIAMCQNATPSDTAWLQKIRPYWSHDYHFHVRLKCPAGSPGCVTQTPTVAQLSNGGNGCDDSLTWWVTDALAPPKPSAEPAKPAPRKRGARDYVLAELPAQCRGVLSAP
ncbi:penicillin-insensitive murein endopeptidase [Mangrovicoccus sp. HB161399]|uniref:penicillin-insensitive murein endopeptidase n=1 Tax=Mangrovicoccus sp. HB161399 TaxID=2720392 RepID=UPI00352C0154